MNDQKSKNDWVPVYDAAGNRVGAAAKAQVHADGSRHRSALILVTRPPEVLVNLRHRKQSYPGCFDILGGHEAVRDDRSLDRTALREACEELEIRRGVLPVNPDPRPITDEDLHLSSDHNNETSRLYGIKLSDDSTARVSDTGPDDERFELGIRWMTLAALEDLYAHDPLQFADGLGRVLTKMAADAAFRSMIYKFVESSQ